MKSITLQRLKENYQEWKRAVIVLTQESFSRVATINERSFEINSNAKYFSDDKLGSSLFGKCLSDSTIERLDHLLQVGFIEIEYCYILT